MGMAATKQASIGKWLVLKWYSQNAWSCSGLTSLAEYTSGMDGYMVCTAWRAMLVLWLMCVLLVISLPWSRFDGIPHWQSVHWIPFRDLTWHRTVLLEAVLNILAFVPVGYLSVRSVCSLKWSPLLMACLIGFVSSFSIETYQLFCLDRVPSIGDVLMNVIGTASGAWLAFTIDQILGWWSLRFRNSRAGVT
jgi:glycopeptide antibiotics resistance protein